MSVGSAFAARGGVSGGGGGIAPVDPAGPALIEQALREAPLVLTLYFNRRESLELQNPTAIGRLLFNGEQRIQDLIKSSAIETSSRCRDPHGKTRDGAAPGKRPQSICMDVASLNRKLSIDNYWSQTIALAGHELSHLLGTNEKEATELQGEILKEIRFQPPFIAAALRNSYLFSFFELDKKLKAAIEADPKNPMQIHDAWAGLSSDASFLTRNEVRETRGLQVPTASAYWLGKALQWKLEFLSVGGYLQGGGNSPSWQEMLNKGFAGRNSVTLGDLVRRMEDSAVPETLAPLVIELPVNDAAYQREVASILGLRAELETLARKTPAAWTALVEKDYTKAGKNEIEWITQRVQLRARDLQIRVNGETLGQAGAQLKVSSDPGNLRYWSLEATWQERGREMRAFFYFRADNKEWWVDEIRTYDGSAEGDWVYYYGDYFRRPLGTDFEGDVTLAGWNEDKTTSVLQLKGLSIRVTPAT